MPEIISLAERKRERRIHSDTQMIEKVVDGKIVAWLFYGGSLAIFSLDRTYLK
jgi:hypothetical protein